MEASIAEELRRDKAAAAAADRGEIVVSDVFSKDFGKAKKAAGGGRRRRRRDDVDVPGPR